MPRPPLYPTARLDIHIGGHKVQAGWDHDQTLVRFHGDHQVRSNPMGDKAACRFHNFWTIVTPSDWSCLFVNPLNRPNKVFDTIVGIVDTDTCGAAAHFQFLPPGADGLHVIEKGSPMVRVIPFRRHTAHLSAENRPETAAEKTNHAGVQRGSGSIQGWYRTEALAWR